MESVTKKITWILKNVTKEKLRTYDFKKRFVSDDFTINFGDQIYDKWYLTAFTTDGFLAFFLVYKTTNLDPDLNVSVKYFCGQQLKHSFEQKGKIFQANGYGIPRLMTLHALMTYVDENNNLTLNVEITLSKPRANLNVEVIPQSNVVRESFEEFVENDSFSDASFMCCDQVKVTAHRLLLAKKSVAFKTIFDTMKTQRKKIHHFKEIDSITFKEIIKYIYSGNATLVDIHLIEKIYKAAVEFDLAELQLQCVDALTNLIDSKNVLDIYKIANSLQLEQLEGKALQFIMKYFHVLISTPKWSRLSAALKDKVSIAISGLLPSIVLENTL